MKDLLLTFLLLCIPLLCIAQGEENNNGDEGLLSEENWPKVVFTSNVDGTDRNILPGTEVRVELKLETVAANYKWQWDNGSDSVYVFTAEDNTEAEKVAEKKVMLTLIDSLDRRKMDSICFYIWSKPSLDSDIVIGISDKSNTANLDVMYIREGNSVSLQHPIAHGGFSEGWIYEWAIGGITIDRSNPVIPTGLNYTKGLAETNITCLIQNTCKDSIWYTDTLTRPIIICQQPALPTLFTKKGDGTTGTWIIKDYQKQMGNLKVALKMGNSVNDVFIVSSDSIVEANNGYWWFRSNYANEHEDINEKNLCIYTERNYGDSIKVTSQLLMLDADSFSLWDGSTYPDEEVGPVVDDETTDDGENGEGSGTSEENGSLSRVTTSFSISGARTGKPHRGWNIVKMEDGKIRKVIIR